MVLRGPLHLLVETICHMICLGLGPVALQGKCMHFICRRSCILFIVACLLTVLPALAWADADKGRPDQNQNQPGSEIQTLPPVNSYAQQREIDLNSPWRSYSSIAAPPNWGLGNTHGNFEGIFSPVSITASAQPKTSKSNGPKDLAGEPIEVSSGTKISSHTDFALPGEMGLKYVRYYRSGAGWTNNLDYGLETDCGGGVDVHCVHVTLNRPDGSSVKFGGIPGTVGNYPERGGGSLATLTGNADGSYTLHDEDATSQTYDANGRLLSIKDASGIGWNLTYSYNSQTGAWTTRVTHTDGQFMTVVRAGTTTTVTDPGGNVYTDVNSANGETVTFPGSPSTAITYKYGPYGETEADFNGVAYLYTTYYDCAVGNGAHLYLANNTHMADGSQVTSIAYTSACGLTATISNALGHTAANQYVSAHDANDGAYYQLASVSDPAVVDGPATTQTRSYDANGNLTQTVDNDGVTHTYNYAVNGQLQTETEASGTSVARKTDYVWDPNQQLNRLTSVTVEGESRTSYAYNAQNRLASVTRTNLTAVGTPNQSLTTTYVYTLYGNGMVQSMTMTAPSPGNSAKVTTNYDTLGNVTSIVDGLGHTTTYTGYNALGEPGHVTGANGDVTDYTYDARGRVAAKTTHPNGTTATWTYAYDGFGLLAKVTAPDNEVTTTTRNPYMQVTAVTHNDKDGTSTETFGYDPNGDVTSDEIARGSDIGKSTTIVYDALGRVYQRKGNHGQVLTYAYDGNGNVLSITDALGHKTSYQYDALNRVIKTTNAAGGTTQYAYDAGDHVVGVTDPRGLSTGYAYDGFGQLWAQTSPDTGTTRFNYDSYGRLASKTRADGVQTTYTYDAIDRLTKATASGQTQTWVYDTCTNGKGRLCSAVNGVDTTSYAYTPEGWISGRGFSFQGTSYSYALGYSYDSTGHLSVVNYPDGNQAIYDYSNGSVSDVRLKVGTYYVTGVSGVAYRPMNAAMSNWTSYNGLVNSIVYDNDLRPTYIGVHNIQGLHFQYDTADEITKITNDTDPTMTEGFAYDALSRLYSVRSSAENEDYRYDPDGNRTLAIVNGVTTTSYYGSTSNRLDHSYTGSNPAVGYHYDANGNLTASNGGPSYAYDPFNRMSAASTTHFDVNPEGQRLRKYTSSTMTFFAPDVGGNLLSEDLNGGWRDYVWLNGRLVTVIANGGIFPLHDDQTGRPQVMTQPNAQSIDWAARNTAFDRTVTTNAWGSFNIGFPGQYNDTEVGDYWYNGARDYSASLGRYIESDPIGLAGGINTYIYAGGNPITYTDPTGKVFGIDDATVGTVLVGAAVVGGVGAFIGTKLGGGTWGQAFAAVPGGAVGGVVFVVVAGSGAVTATTVAAGTVLDLGINAAMDAWSASTVTGPLPAPRKPDCL